jgi:uncharacterized membrane protein
LPGRPLEPLLWKIGGSTQKLANMSTADATRDNVKSTIEPRIKGVRNKIEPQLQNVREHLPERNTVQGILAWIAVGFTALTVGGLTLTGGAIFLAIATPILLLLSPILVPVGGVLFGVTATFLTVVGTTLAFISTIVWLYKYFKGEEPVYYDRVDAARSRIAHTANDVKEWARDHVPQVQAAPSA